MTSRSLPKQNENRYINMLKKNLRDKQMFLNFLVSEQFCLFHKKNINSAGNFFLIIFDCICTIKLHDVHVHQ